MMSSLPCEGAPPLRRTTQVGARDRCFNGSGTPPPPRRRRSPPANPFAEKTDAVVPASRQGDGRDRLGDAIEIFQNAIRNCFGTVAALPFLLQGIGGCLQQTTRLLEVDRHRGACPVRGVQITFERFDAVAPLRQGGGRTLDRDDQVLRRRTLP